MKKGLLIVLLGLLVGITPAQTSIERKLSVSLSTDEIKIGEQSVLKLLFQAQKADSVRWIAWLDTLSKHIDVVRVGSIDTLVDSLVKEKVLYRQEVYITSFDSGLYPIIPLVVYCNNIPYESSAMLLEVQTIAVDTTKAIFDIKKPLEVQYSWWDWLKDHALEVFLSVVALAMLAFLIWYFYRKHKNRPSQVPITPEVFIPPHELALQKLHALKAEGLWQHGQYKTYHSNISDIIRTYIEQRFQVSAMEQTTFEIMRSLRTASISPTALEKLQQMLVLSDLVKFAKEQPLAHENEQSLNQAVQFVELTILNSSGNVE